MARHYSLYFTYLFTYLIQTSTLQPGYYYYLYFMMSKLRPRHNRVWLRNVRKKHSVIICWILKICKALSQSLSNVRMVQGRVSSLRHHGLRASGAWLRLEVVSSTLVMYGYEHWAIKKAEHWRDDAFKLCWRSLLRVHCTARSNQSILQEISPEYSLEGLMLKLKLPHFGHLMWRTDSLEKTLMLGKTEGRRRRGRQRMRRITD